MYDKHYYLFPWSINGFFFPTNVFPELFQITTWHSWCSVKISSCLPPIGIAPRLVLSGNPILSRWHLETDLIWAIAHLGFFLLRSLSSAFDSSLTSWEQTFIYIKNFLCGKVKANKLKLSCWDFLCCVFEFDKHALIRKVDSEAGSCDSWNILKIQVRVNVGIFRVYTMEWCKK